MIEHPFAVMIFMMLLVMAMCIGGLILVSLLLV